jgi:predicted nucleic acid-binding protein
MDKPSVYLETSVISYYTSRFSRDLIVAGHQQITREWVDVHLGRFDAYASEIVVDECSKGDSTAAQARLEFLDSVEMLELTSNVLALARSFVDACVIPKPYSEDALHIATATSHGIDYLVTWNCKHIANAQIWNGLRRVSGGMGFELPIICTPEELMEDCDVR